MADGPHLARQYVLDKKRQQDASQQKCQKCLQMGHWTYECSNKRKYVQRQSRTVIMNKKRKALLSAIEGGTNSVSTGIEKKKEHKKKTSEKSAGSDSEDQSDSDDSSSDDSSSDSDSDSSSSESSSSDSDTSSSSSSSSSSESDHKKSKHRKRKKKSSRS